MTKTTSTLALFAIALMLPAMASAGKSKLVTPKEGTYLYALVQGLTTIKDGKFDEWIDKFCHPDDLCYTENAKKSLLKYNLPAIKRIAGQCLKDAPKMKVTRTDGDAAKGDTEIKVFVECDPKGMPRPFRLKLHGKDWKFKSI